MLFHIMNVNRIRIAFKSYKKYLVNQTSCGSEFKSNYSTTKRNLYPVKMRVMDSNSKQHIDARTKLDYDFYDLTVSVVWYC